MNIGDYSFHDSQILEVKEIADQTLEFLIDFRTDWDNDIFETRVLRFKNVIKYQIDEIPFAGQPTILNILDFGKQMSVWGEGRNRIEAIRNKIEIETTAGNRIVVYSECELEKPV